MLCKSNWNSDTLLLIWCYYHCFNRWGNVHLRQGNTSQGPGSWAHIWTQLWLQSPCKWPFQVWQINGSCAATLWSCVSLIDHGIISCSLRFGLRTLLNTALLVATVANWAALVLDIKPLCHLSFICVFAQNGIVEVWRIFVVVDFYRSIYNLSFPKHL